MVVSRERRRLARLRRLGSLLAPFWVWLVIRLMNGEPIALGPPHLPLLVSLHSARVQRRPARSPPGLPSRLRRTFAGPQRAGRHRVLLVSIEHLGSARTPTRAAPARQR